MKKSINFTFLYKKYPGQWVALGNDEKTVFAAGKTAKQTLEICCLFRLRLSIYLKYSSTKTKLEWLESAIEFANSTKKAFPKSS